MVGLELTMEKAPLLADALILRSMLVCLSHGSPGLCNTCAICIRFIEEYNLCIRTCMVLLIHVSQVHEFMGSTMFWLNETHCLKSFADIPKDSNENTVRAVLTLTL